MNQTVPALKSSAPPHNVDSKPCPSAYHPYHMTGSFEVSRLQTYRCMVLFEKPREYANEQDVTVDKFTVQTKALNLRECRFLFTFTRHVNCLMQNVDQELQGSLM